MKLTPLRRDARLVQPNGFPDIEGEELIQNMEELRSRFLTNNAYTVANLPAAADYPYSRTFVTDASATTFASIVAGGGANIVPVFSNGTNWVIG